MKDTSRPTYKGLESLSKPNYEAEYHRLYQKWLSTQMALDDALELITSLKLLLEEK